MNRYPNNRRLRLRDPGPGFVIAATEPGAGDLIAAPAAGARFGTTLLRAPPVGALLAQKHVEIRL